MSGVYIPGMEMPDRCFSCPMCDTDCCGISRGSYIEYREIYVDVAMDGRPDWCPLVPVPPHGRLIDAEELIDAIIAKYIRRERHRELVFAVAQIKQDMADIINEIPTIIPAEEGEG